MKIPVSPPSVEEIIPKLLASNYQKTMEILYHQESTDQKGRYLHWDKLMHVQPPERLTSEFWWAGIKFARQKLYKSLKILDKNKSPFKVATPDSVLKELHWLDINTAGSLSARMPIATQQMKNTYLIRSFVEEAINSSQLEGASTTRSVAKELIRQGRRPIDKDEQMILNNYEAMRFIKDSTGEPLSTELILELHRILTKDTLENPDSVGRFRTDKDAVYVVDRTGGGILHTPPKAEELPERMRILCDFANETNGDVFIHPIIRAILLHFMFAYDHPFEDGNGRTARALFYWSVARQGYWIMEFLSISKIIKAAPIKYGRAFLYTETDENDTTYFVIHQLDVIRKAIQQLNSFLDRKVKEIEAAEISLRGSQKLHALLNPRQLALLRHALKHPGFVYGIKEHQRTHGVVYQTARNDLLVMSDKLKLLIKKKSGRSFIFISPDDLQKRIERVRA
jgi:Fic family protein